MFIIKKNIIIPLRNVIFGTLRAHNALWQKY